MKILDVLRQYEDGFLEEIYLLREERDALRRDNKELRDQLARYMAQLPRRTLEAAMAGAYGKPEE